MFKRNLRANVKQLMERPSFDMSTSDRINTCWDLIVSIYKFLLVPLGHNLT